LFGHAWLDNGSWAMRSRVRIRLEHFNTGTLEKDKWQFNEKKVKHPEVGFGVGSDLYLGFGPLLYSKENKRTELKQKAIKAEEKNSLILIYPKQNEETFKQIMQLIHWFGTLGGRSRNGWGSIAVKAVNLTSSGITPSLHLENEAQDYSILLSGKANLIAFQRPLKSCLTEEWPHAIGEDEKGVLIWKTEACNTWMQVMRQLAEIKIGYRTSLSVISSFDERQILALPVTHHTPRDLKNDRVTNQLRVKLIKHQDRFYGLVFHLPCKIPKVVSDKLKQPAAQILLANQEAIWLKVHQYLDQHLQRTGSLNNGK
jgi:CRISPR-associated protein Cmr1